MYCNHLLSNIEIFGHCPTVIRADDEGANPGTSLKDELGIQLSLFQFIIQSARDEDPGVDLEEESDAQGEKDEEPERRGEGTQKKRHGELQKK